MEELNGPLPSTEDFAQHSIEAANANADLGLIDNLNNLENTPIYIMKQLSD